MFNNLLGNMKHVQVNPDDLSQVITLDQDGTPVTLRDLIAQSPSSSTLAAFGAAPAPCTLVIKPVRDLNEMDLEKVSLAFLDEVPKDEVLEIMGGGSFTVDQLREEVKKRTAIGQRLMEIVRQDSIFMEEAVKQGKISVAQDDLIQIPDFDC